MQLPPPLISSFQRFPVQRFTDLLCFCVAEEVTGTRMTRQDIRQSHLMCHKEYMWHLGNPYAGCTEVPHRSVTVPEGIYIETKSLTFCRNW